MGNRFVTVYFGVAMNRFCRDKKYSVLFNYMTVCLFLYWLKDTLSRGRDTVEFPAQTGRNSYIIIM